jgi:hypothetical protein
LLVASPGHAQSLFEGRWRPDASTIQGDAKPAVILLKDGIFKRDSEDGVKADGGSHPVSGDGYIDEMAITIVGDRMVREVDRVHGKIVYSIDYLLSSDGDVLTWKVTSFANPAGKPVHSESRQRRVGILPPGSHPISGSWQQTALNVEVGATDWILKHDGDRFSSWSLQGVGYDAIVGGPAVPITGDEAGGMATVTMPRPDTIVESLSLNGKVGGILTMTVLSDGKTMRAIGTAPQRNETTIFYLHKQ